MGKIYCIKFQVILFITYILCDIYMTIDYTSAVRACAYVHNTRKFRGTKMLIMNYADNLTAKFRGREYCACDALMLDDSKCHYSARA